MKHQSTKRMLHKSASQLAHRRAGMAVVQGDAAVLEQTMAGEALHVPKST
jgi:hypothetical protein